MSTAVLALLLLAGVAYGLGHGCVKVYKDCNYGGESIEYCQDTSALDYWSGGQYHWHFNDAISSVQIGRDVRKVSLYEHGNYGGGVYHVYENHVCLTGVGFNDKASSLRIEVVPQPTDCVRLWKGIYTGGYHDFCQNTPAMPATWDDKAKSMRKGSSVVRTKLYYNDNYAGSVIDTIQISINNLPPYISSIAMDVVPHNCIRVFSSVGFDGSQRDFCGDTAQLGWWDNRIYSFILGRDVNRVFLYLEPNYNNWAYPTNPEWVASANMGHIGYFGGKVSSFKLIS